MKSMRTGGDTMLRNRGLRALIAMLDGFRDRGIRTAIGAAALVACGLSPSQANAAQLSPDGIIYDTVNNISWLTDGDLPATNKFGLPVCNDVTNPKMCVPLGELFYHQLGFAPGTPVVATPDIAVGPFKNIQPYLYWACEGATIQSACQTDDPATGFEWSFSFGNGFQGTDVLKNDLYVTAYFVGPPSQRARETPRVIPFRR
jgi:hypothetical protein